MPEVCVDASVAIKWVLQNEPVRRKALQLLDAARMKRIRLIAPPLFEMEVDGIITTHAAEGRIPYSKVLTLLRQLDRVPVAIISHPQIRQRARYIALSFDQSKVYDATYAALAELRGCDFWTADRHFYEAVRDELAFVRYLPDYSG